MDVLKSACYELWVFSTLKMISFRNTSPAVASYETYDINNAIEDPCCHELQSLHQDKWLGIS